MSRPLRRYTFALAERLGKTHNELLESISASEIMEWIAFDKTSDKDWLEQYKHDQEVERQKELSDEERSAMIRRLFGG